MSKSNPAIDPTAKASSLSDAGAPEGRSTQELLLAKADALFRAGAECCRQHRRYSALVERGASVKEQRRAVAMVRLCDEHLQEAAASYEKTAGRVEGLKGEEWWRRANALWMAAREYARRRTVARRSAAQLEQQDASTMGELALDYDLEASALLLISQAVESYKKTRPEAELCPPAPARATNNGERTVT